jgi:hypothetical protein
MRSGIVSLSEVLWKGCPFWQDLSDNFPILDGLAHGWVVFLGKIGYDINGHLQPQTLESPKPCHEVAEVIVSHGCNAAEKEKKAAFPKN